MWNHTQQLLFEKFGELPVMKAVEEKNRILAETYTEVREFFKPKGITIESLGGQGGLVFDDVGIQQAIDKILVAEQAEEIATKEQAGQKVLNQTAALNAQNDAEIAQIQARGVASSTLIIATAEAGALRLKGEALNEFPNLTAQTIAERSTGQVPQMLVVGNDGANLPFIWQLPQPNKPVTSTVAAN